MQINLLENLMANYDLFSAQKTIGHSYPNSAKRSAGKGSAKTESILTS